MAGNEVISFLEQQKREDALISEHFRYYDKCGEVTVRPVFWEKSAMTNPNVLLSFLIRKNHAVSDS